MTAKKFELKLETKAKHDKTVRLTPAPGQRGLPTLLITPPICSERRGLECYIKWAAKLP